MARIRTVKPEMWTDEKFTECSLSARLLLIGMLNFADDNGNIQRSAKQLKMKIFPADDIDCEPLLQELITHGLLMEYSVNENKYLNIKGFKKHQKINRPSSSSIPEPKFTEDSLNTHGGLTEGREGKGKEKKNNKKKISLSEWENLNGEFNISHLGNWVDEKKLSPAKLEPCIEAFRLSCQQHGYEYLDFAATFKKWHQDMLPKLQRDLTQSQRDELMRQKWRV